MIIGLSDLICKTASPDLEEGEVFCDESESAKIGIAAIMKTDSNTSLKLILCFIKNWFWNLCMQI